jgi:hypothetical protein
VIPDLGVVNDEQDALLVGNRAGHRQGSALLLRVDKSAKPSLANEFGPELQGEPSLPDAARARDQQRGSFRVALAPLAQTFQLHLPANEVRFASLRSQQRREAVVLSPHNMLDRAT